MVWRFVGTDASLRSQFNKGDYYATNGYFSTTEVESDVVQSGQLLLLCTGRTQETARLDVYFRVIADGIMPSTTNVGDEWRQRVSGSAEYVLNTAGLDLTTSASKYNLVRVDISNNGIVTQDSAGDYRIADATDVYNSIAAGTDEGRRHILNELRGITGTPNSRLTSVRDGVTWYSSGIGYAGATSTQATFATFGVVGGDFFMEVVAPDEDLSLITGQMVVFTISAGSGFPTGIAAGNTYTATVSAIGGTNAIPLIILENVIENGTSNVITPDVGSHSTAVDVILQVYHAQLNEEYVLGPELLIDTVDDMSALQKTELRDAARVNFRNRVEIARIFNEDGTEIPDIASFPGDGESVIVMIRASGVSGITELVIDFDGNLHRTVTDTGILAPLNTGDDVDFEITVPLSSITYTATTEVEILLEGGTSADIELEVAV